MSARQPSEIDRLLGLVCSQLGLCGTPAPTGPGRAQPPPREHVERARSLLEERRQRASLLPEGLFGEPAWEMLLLLYIADGTHLMSVGGLAQVWPGHSSAALRWIDALEAERLVKRGEHPLDRQQAIITLTKAGRDALDLYFAAIAPPRS